MKVGSIKDRILGRAWRLWNLWPPFFGAGIRLTQVSPDWSRVEVQLKLRFWNANYVGTQFGGSLFAMSDPFLMVMALRRLGRDFVVWDKASRIRFVRPGTSDCRVVFELNDHLLAELRDRALAEQKFDWVIPVEIKDREGRVVARVEKTLYVATRDYYNSRKGTADASLDSAPPSNESARTPKG